jgi:hypothetical protein
MLKKSMQPKFGKEGHPYSNTPGSPKLAKLSSERKNDKKLPHAGQPSLSKWKNPFPYEEK